jgi:hypothetical protein
MIFISRRASASLWRVRTSAMLTKRGGSAGSDSAGLGQRSRERRIAGAIAVSLQPVADGHPEGSRTQLRLRRRVRAARAGAPTDYVSLRLTAGGRGRCCAASPALRAVAPVGERRRVRAPRCLGDDPPHPHRGARIAVGGALRASPRVGPVVDPWWTLEGVIRRAARSPLPLCTWKSSVSTSARQGGLRFDILRRSRETAFRCGTGIAPGGFEPPTSRL